MRFGNIGIRRVDGSWEHRLYGDKWFIQLSPYSFIGATVSFVLKLWRRKLRRRKLKRRKLRRKK